MYKLTFESKFNNKLNDLKNMVHSMDGDFTAQVFGYEMDGQTIVQDFKWLIEQLEQSGEEFGQLEDSYIKLKEENEKLKEKVKWLEMHNEQLQDTDYEVEVKSSFKF